MVLYGFSRFCRILSGMNFLTTNIFRLKNKAFQILVNLLLSAAVTAILIVIVLFADIPNPNLILMTGIVVITVLLGFLPGLIPSASMIVYSFWFFSTGNDFVTFTSVNATKVAVTIVTGVLCYGFVGVINFLYVKNTTSLMESNRTLNEANQELRRISKTDTLTRTKNRYSLRHDFPSFLGKDIQVLIFDVDNFKSINDSYGHQAGDIVLSEISRITKEIFEEESVYRYGGDEFVVIKTTLALSEFKAMVEKLNASVHEVVFEGKKIDVCLSVGYTYGVPATHEDLRGMIRYADELMYEVKSGSKNGALGKKYDQDI